MSLRNEEQLRQEIEAAAREHGIASPGNAVATILPHATIVGRPDVGPDARESCVITPGKGYQSIPDAVRDYAAAENHRNALEPDRNRRTADYIAGRTGPRPGRPGFRGAHV